MTQEHHHPDRRKKKRLGLKITIGVMLLLFLGGGAYAFSVYHSIASTLDKTHQPLSVQTDKRIINLAEKDPFSVLLLGIDKREGDRGRPDSLILLTVNPHEESIKMVSIPRDTLTEIEGQKTRDKLNHAYTYGGTDLSIKTVEKLLDIPVDYFLEVNMDGFKDLVDAVGGVSVNNTLEFSYGGEHFPLGDINLNGEEALRYSQMRHEDPNGDFGRQERQRKIIQAFIKEAAQVKTLANYGNILEAIGNNVKTNFTFDALKSIQANYMDARHNVEQIQVNGRGQETDGVYYYHIAEQEKQKLTDALKKHMLIE
ncbi:trascriptional regulator [Mesobacillus campisalis]|uniref:Polyisoprenyl-teichoic acid--peptidoglycan teichoic acid transferase TagU n=1 Tax=Mesobacillus campisalis TaxID=1408103 RepID=A0A0M2SX35_9BACI|nr:trascriptional regulator [Mesobacillus campisalis]